jgi:hypothetical protein
VEPARQDHWRSIGRAFTRGYHAAASENREPVRPERTRRQRFRRWLINPLASKRLLRRRNGIWWAVLLRLAFVLVPVVLILQLSQRL